MYNQNFNLNLLIKKALENRDKRARQIIASRFGLDASPKTLAVLGEEYGLTRERVRQIESAALQAIRQEIEKHEEAIKFLELAEEYLNNLGHLRRADWTAHDFASLLGGNHSETSIYNQLNFLAKVVGYPHLAGGGKFHIFWYNKDDIYKKALNLIEELFNFQEPDFEAFLNYASQKFKLKDFMIINQVAVHKNFTMGPYGDLGPSHWLQVNPRTVRDRAYLVLERAGRPLHFEEIAKLVNKISDKKRAPATVHNELIKDPRFQLVSRGTYALQ